MSMYPFPCSIMFAYSTIYKEATFNKCCNRMRHDHMLQGLSRGTGIKKKEYSLTNLCQQLNSPWTHLTELWIAKFTHSFSSNFQRLTTGSRRPHWPHGRDGLAWLIWAWISYLRPFNSRIDCPMRSWPRRLKGECYEARELEPLV